MKMTKQEQSRMAYIILQFILRHDPEVSNIVLRGRALLALTAIHRPDYEEYPWMEVIRWMLDQQARKIAKSAT